MEVLDLGPMSFERGAHLLVKRALRALPTGGKLRVVGEDPALPVHLRAWSRAQGHGLEGEVLVRGDAQEGRWRGAERAGHVDPLLQLLPFDPSAGPQLLPFDPFAG